MFSLPALSPNERYVLLGVLQDVREKHKGIIEAHGDYDVPDPVKVFDSVVKKIESAPMLEVGNNVN